MKKIILILITSIFVGVSGFILFALNQGAATQFQQTFDSFGVAPPQVASLLFSNIEYWWLLLSVIAVLSFLLVIFGKLKTSIVISFASIASLVAVVYGPIIKMGNVI